MSRNVRLVLALASVLATLSGAGAAQAASAPSTIGISQSFRDFGLRYPGAYDPNRSYDATKDITKSTSWPGLGIKALRVIVPWDIALRDSSKPGYARKVEFEKWLERVKAVGGSPYVVFGPTEEATNLADSSHKTRLEGSPKGLVAPYPADYEKAIEKFLEIWGVGGSASGTTYARVKLIGAWNEPNLARLEMGLPGHQTGKNKIFMPGSTRSLADRGGCGHATVTNCGPYVAAQYWFKARQAMVAVQNCTSCYVVAGEFTGASGPKTKPYWDIYANKIEAVSGGLKPAIISFHSHHDYLPEAKTGCKPGQLGKCTTVAFYKWLKARGNGWQDRKIWNTEVGAGHYETTDTEQKKRLEFLLKTTGNYHVKRIYYYNYWPSGQTKTDRGLLNGGSNVNTSPRPAYNVIKALTCPNSPCASASADTFEAGAQIAEAEPDTSEPELPAEEAEVKEEFTTDEVEISEDQLPEVETVGASNIRTTEATISGIVSPNEENATFHFEYGPTEAYGSVTGSEEVSGSEEISKSALLKNLTPGTTYHYRVVASNTYGQSEGGDQTFTTPAGSSPSAVVVPVSGYQVIYYVNTNGGISYWSWTPGIGWSNVTLGGSVAPGTSPSVAVNPNSGYQVAYYQNSGGGISYWSWMPGIGWSNGTLGGSAAPGSSPSVAININDGHQAVYYQNAANGLSRWSFSSGAGWTNMTLGGSVKSGTSPSVAMNLNDGYQVAYYQNANGGVSYWSWASGVGWTNGTPGGSVAPGTSPSVALATNTGYQVAYYQNSGGGISYWSWMPGSGWNNGTLGGSVSPGTSPSVALNMNDGYQTIYYRNSAGGLSRWSWASGSGWTNMTLGGSVAAYGSPSAALSPSTGYQVAYFRNSAGTVSHWSWMSPSGWSTGTP